MEELDGDEVFEEKEYKQQVGMFVPENNIGKTIDSKELLLDLIELKQEIRMNIYMLDRIKDYIDFETEIQKTKIIPANTHALYVYHYKMMLDNPDSYVPVYTKADYDELLNTINNDRNTYKSYREFIRKSKNNLTI